MAFGIDFCMRILQVVHGFPPKQRAGTEIYTYSLSRELAKKHEVHVFYPTYEGDGKPSLNSFEMDGLKIHELCLPYSFIERIKRVLDFKLSYKNTKVEEKFRELLDWISPDVIHFQHLISLSASFIEVAKDKNIPTVVTLHDYWFICPKINLLQSDYSICNGPDESCRNCFQCWNEYKTKALSTYLSRQHFPNQIKNLLGIFLKIINSTKKFRKRRNYMKSILLKVDKIVAPSRFLREMFIRYGVLGHKIVYSENGYNLNVFKGFKKKEKDTDKIIFGFVGGISKHKGVHVLVDAFINISEEKAELKIYGNYNPKSDYMKEILTKVKRKKNIKFMGRFKDVKEPYSEIDVLVFPSIWYENCPLVLAEARATKTPVIASDLGAIPEFVKDGKNGLLFEPNNPEDLYEKIMVIIEHHELIEKFKANINPPKSMKDQTKEIEEIYKKLLGVGL